ncbi:MAG: hypothetical protein ACPGUV_01010 [Polyangiales bacterium]
MSAAAIEARLQQVSALTDLRPETRLDAKLDMSPAGMEARLAEVSQLLQLCRTLATTAAVPAGPPGDGEPPPGATGCRASLRDQAE